MTRYIVSWDTTLFYEASIEAKDEEEAREKFEELLSGDGLEEHEREESFNEGSESFTEAE